MNRRSNSQSIMSKYSDTPAKKKRLTAAESEMPLMVSYEQRFKGTSMTRDLTDKKPMQTLEEKIEARNKLKEPKEDIIPKRVSVEIAGNRYLLGSNDEMSDARIKRIASVVNTILSNSKENNPGLTNSKVTTLALIDACDQILALKDENSNLKTELMYLQQKVTTEEMTHKHEPTPMELLAGENAE